MPRRSSIATLPPDVRRELELRLVASGFSDYDGHTAWLHDRGHTISRSSLGRYGLELRELLRSAGGSFVYDAIVQINKRLDDIERAIS